MQKDSLVLSATFSRMLERIIRTTIEVETSPYIITPDHWLEIAEENRVKTLPNGTVKKVSAYAAIAGHVDPLIYHPRHYFGGRDWARIATMSTTEMQCVPSFNPFSSKTKKIPVDIDTILFREMRTFARQQAEISYTLQDHTIYAKGGKGPTIPGQTNGIYLEWVQSKDDPSKNHWSGTLLELYQGGPTPEWIPTGIPIDPEITAREIRARWLLGNADIDLLKTPPQVLFPQLEALIMFEPEIARQRLRQYWECKSCSSYVLQLSNPFFGICERSTQDLELLALQLQGAS